MPDRIEQMRRTFLRDASNESAFAILRQHHQARGELEELADLHERHADHQREPRRAAELLWRAAEICRERNDDEGEVRALYKTLTQDRAHRRALDRLKARAQERERWAELVDLLQFELAVLAEAGGQGIRAARLELQLGQIWHQQLFRLDRAILHYKRAFNADSSSADAIDAGRRVHAAVGQWQTVAQLLEIELSTAADTRRKVDLLAELAELQRSKIGDLEAAARSLTQASQLRPGNEQLLEPLGEIYASPEWPTPGGLDKSASIYMQIAQRYQSQGDRDRAIDYLRRALGADPENETAAARLDRAYRETGRWEDLDRLYRQRISVATEIEARDLQLRRAELLERKLGDPAGVRACYEAVLPHEPLGGPASTRLKDLYRSAGEWQELHALLERELEGATDRATRLRLMLDIATLKRDRLDDGEGAAVLLHEVLQIDPGHRKALTAYEDYFRHKGDYRNLAELLRFAAQTARETGVPPMEVAARLEELAAVSEQRLGDLEGAIDAWRQIAEIHPDVQRAEGEIRRLGAALRSWTETLGLLRDEVEQSLSPTQRLQALQRLAEAHRQHQVDPPGLALVLREILQLDPRDEQASRLLIEVYEGEADHEGMAWALRNKLDGILTAAERANLLRRLADICADELEQPKAALQAYKDLLQLMPQDRRVLAKVQHLLDEADDIDQLTRVLEQRVEAARSTDERLKALLDLATLFDTRLEAPSRAITCWEEVRGLTPTDEAALAALARLYQRTGQPAKLLEVLQAQVAAQADAPPAARAATLRQIASLADEQLDQPKVAAQAYDELSRLLPASRDALRALQRLYARLERPEKLVEVIDRQIELSDDAEERVVLAFKQVDVLETSLGDSERAIEVFQRIVTELAPGDLDALRRLRSLRLRRGDHVRAVELAERELFLTPADRPDDRRELALEIAELWWNKVGDVQRAQLAYERVLEIEPQHLPALLELRRIYHRGESYQKLVALAPTLLARIDDDQERRVLLFEVAEVCERSLRDPLRAFEWYRRAHTLYGAADDAALDQLRRVAEQHGLWEELLSVHAESRRRVLGSKQFLGLTREMAAVCREHLDDPARAFEVIREALQVDPTGGEVLGELEALAGPAELHHELLDIYAQILSHEQEPERLATLLERSATVAEQALGDPTRALTAHVRRYAVLARAGSALSEEDERAAVAEIERLAGETRRWSDALAVHQHRFDLAADEDRKLEILRHVADLFEHRIGDLRQAFAVHLRAFSIRQQSELINNAWRLARELSRAPSSAGHSERPHPSPPLVIAAQQDRGESTIEISHSDILELGASGDARVSSTRKPARDDATIELSGKDLQRAMVSSSMPPLVIEPSKARRGEATIDLTISDLVEVSDKIPGRSPLAGLSPTAGRGGATASGVPSLPDGLDPWEAIAQTYLGLEFEDDQTRVRHLLSVAEVWHEGAGAFERAFDALGEAATIAPFDPLLERRLRLLGEQLGSFDRVIEIYRDQIERAADASTLLNLHLKVADLVLEHGRPEEAEAHLSAALAIQPTDQVAAERLTTLYQRSERWQDLAELLSRQLQTLSGKLGAEQRAQRLRLLADLNEHHLDRPFEAAEALARLSAEQARPDFETLARMADLHERLGLWPKAIETLERLVELAQDDPTRTALVLRIARAYREEIELPDRAIESYERALIYDADSVEALTALEQLYRQHDRPERLASVLERQVELVDEQQDPAGRRALLTRLARALEELGNHAGAAQHLQRARSLGEPDPAIEEGLARVLVSGGRAAEAVQLLRDQVARARRQGRPVEAVAGMLVGLARLQRDRLDDRAACRAALQEALATAPGFEPALAELSLLAADEGDWAAYAELQLQIAEAMSDLDDALPLLGRAGATLTDRGQTAEATRIYERALQLRPDDQSIVDVLLDLAGDDPERRHVLLLHKLDLVTDPPARATLLTEVGLLRQACGGPVSEIAEIYRQALAEQPDHVPTVDALSALHLQQGQVEQASRLLQEAIGRIEGTATALSAGPLYYRLGEIFERGGRSEEGYKHLMQALRLQPKNLLLRLAVGRNRYQAHRWREALRHLGEAAEHPDAGEQPRVAAEALYCAAQCERRLRRPERALPLFQAAVRLDPDHVGALKELSSAAIDRGAIDEAAAMLQRVARATDDPRERVRLLTTLGELCLEQLGDARRAAACYADLVDQLVVAADGDAAAATSRSAPSAIDDATRLTLLPQLLPVLRDNGQHAAAARAATALAAVLEGDHERRHVLLIAAAEHQAAGERDDADARWREVLDLDPGCGEAVEGLGTSLERRERLDEAVELLESHLWRVPPPHDDETRAQRMRLYETLARVQQARRQTAAAIEALERRIKLGESVPVRLTLAELHDAHGGRQDAALANHRVLARDVTQVRSLRVVARAALRSGARYRAHCICQVLATLHHEGDGPDDPADELRQALADYQPAVQDIDAPYEGAVSEADRLSFLTLPEVNSLRQVFATLWEAAPTLFSRELSDFGVTSSDRVSPVEKSNLALVYSAISRALGIRRTQLFLRKRAPAGTADVTVVCRAPTAVIVTADFAEQRAVDEMRFALARALELAQPSYVLAAGLERAAFTRLLAGLLHAFHPRHVRRRRVSDEVADEVERLRRDLPYKVSRRLAELFREQPDTPFDSGAWRQAVQITVNRMGMLFCGDVEVALRLLRTEVSGLGERPLRELLHASPVVHDLLSFAASDALYICRGKLGLGESG